MTHPDPHPTDQPDPTGAVRPGYDRVGREAMRQALLDGNASIADAVAAYPEWAVLAELAGLDPHDTTRIPIPDTPDTDTGAGVGVGSGDRGPGRDPFTGRVLPAGLSPGDRADYLDAAQDHYEDAAGYQAISDEYDVGLGADMTWAEYLHSRTAPATAHDPATGPTAGAAVEGPAGLAPPPVAELGDDDGWAWLL
jgi:hypothetical protein